MSRGPIKPLQAQHVATAARIANARTAFAMNSAVPAALAATAYAMLDVVHPVHAATAVAVATSN